MTIIDITLLILKELGMNALSEADQLAWINNYLNNVGVFDTQGIESVKNFVFIWNLFEGKMCNEHATVSEFERIVNRLNSEQKLQSNGFMPQLEYFRNRYITGSNTNNRFNALRFRPSDRRAFVEQVLIGTESGPTNIVLALLIIVYRLRNNLFHGIKSLANIDEQVDNFRNANQLLIHLLELDRDRHYS